MQPRPFVRREMVDALRTTDEFDVLVIGGGITGCGVALDAVTRGLSVGLVERDDFASGTSSKSSKLIHGGLRYLQQGDVRLVYEALRERQRLIRNAPHLVSVLPFLIPVLTRDGPVSKRIAKALRSALWMYDLTGGLRIGKRHRRLDAAEAHRACPTLDPSKLSSGFVYYDAQADDARVTLAVARTAADHGAAVANRCEVIDLLTDDSGRTCGAVVRAAGDDEPFEVRARCVVSATGVWADRIRMLDRPDTGGVDPDSIRPAKGVHITVPWELVRNEIAVIISVPKDKRSLFLIPWRPLPDGGFEHCYVGTTDTDYAGDLDDPHTDGADVEYVLRALNHSVTPPNGAPITADDVTGVWAGLRPLVKAASSGRTADLSRRHRVTVSPSGVVSVTGGKFTTYREMAEDTVDEVMRLLGRRGRCRTKRLRLHEAADLTGSATSELDRALVPGLHYTGHDAVRAVRDEMATTLIDVLARRTTAHLEDRAACLAAADDVAELLAGELGWGREETRAQVAAYRSLCHAEEAALAAESSPS